MATGSASTPESLLSGLRRSDSKHPLTTCRGTTNAGRPCRRSLAAAVNALNAAEAEHEESSVVAVVEDTEYGSEITAFFCWQHKDQADAYHAANAKTVELKTRGSLEDMMSNIGLQDLRGSRATRQPMSLKTPSARVVIKREPGTWDDPSRFVAPTTRMSTKRPGREMLMLETEEERRERQRLKTSYNQGSPSFWEMFCGCFSTGRNLSEGIERPARRRLTPQKPAESISKCPRDRDNRMHERHDSSIDTADNSANQGRKPATHLHISSQRPPMREVRSQPVVIRKPLSSRPTEHNKRWISASDASVPPTHDQSPSINDAFTVIPRNASISLASSLMTEMSKISSDSRQGYIYMYWLDEALQSHSDDDGTSLLLPSPWKGSSAPISPISRKKILLKIGRAENVHRRLSQWQLQCGYKPLLVRCYPRPESREKVRHLHRVERLIQTELAERNVRRDCECGKEHREWFDVDGKEGVREVDRIIEKWIEWSGRQPDS